MNKKIVILASFTAGLVTTLSCSNMNSNEDTSKPLPEYTKEYAREWEHIKDEHVPLVSIAQDKKIGLTILVTVPLKDASPGHFIETIGIMDDDKKTLYSQTFTRDQKAFSATIPLNRDWNLTKVKVFAKCNLHDTWTVGNLDQMRP